MMNIDPAAPAESIQTGCRVDSGTETLLTLAVGFVPAIVIFLNLVTNKTSTPFMRKASGKD